MGARIQLISSKAMNALPSQRVWSAWKVVLILLREACWPGMVSNFDQKVSLPQNVWKEILYLWGRDLTGMMICSTEDFSTRRTVEQGCSRNAFWDSEFLHKRKMVLLRFRVLWYCLFTKELIPWPRIAVFMQLLGEVNCIRNGASSSLESMSSTVPGPNIQSSYCARARQNLCTVWSPIWEISKV